MSPPLLSQSFPLGEPRENELISFLKLSSVTLFQATFLFSGIAYQMKHILSALVIVYQKLTFFLPHVCIYTPSCSNYMLIALRKWGAVKGVVLGVKRIFRCVPWAKGGLDPVPDNPFGDMKWLM